MRRSLAEGVLSLTLDCPERRNALSAEEMEALRAAISDGGGDEAVRVIILDHDGQTFSAGLDLMLAARLVRDAEFAAGTIRAANGLVAAMVDSPKPVVALMRGVAAGVAVPIVLAADLAVCVESAYFVLAFTKIGLMPDGGSSALVAASIGRARAMRMALLAEPLGALEAQAVGLVSHVTTPEQFDSVVADLLTALCDGPAVALARTKDAINQATLSGLENTLALEYQGQMELLASHDFVEGVTAFQNKVRPIFRSVISNGRQPGSSTAATSAGT